MNLADFIGQEVRVVLRKGTYHGEVDVGSIVGTLGSYEAGILVLNDIKKAFGTDHSDVTKKLAMRGKATLIATRNISFVIAEKDVKAD